MATAVDAANLLLGANAVPVPKMTDVFNGKSFDYIPTYIMGVTTVIGVVVIVVTAIMKNYPATSVGVLFTASAAMGTYYSWRYIQRNPLEKQVELIGQLLEKSKTAVGDAERISKSYIELETQIKGSSKTLANLVDDFKKNSKVNLDELKKQIEEAKVQNEKYVRQIADYKKMMDALKKDVASISGGILETNKISDVVKDNVGKIVSETEKIQHEEQDLKVDVAGMDRENKELEDNIAVVKSRIKALTDKIKSLEDLQAESKKEMERQAEIIKKIGTHVDGLEQAAKSEEKTAEQLNSTSGSLAQQRDMITQLTATIRDYIKREEQEDK